MIEKLIKRLEEIAKKNKDHFEYQIGILPTPAGLQYRFLAIETTDNHQIFAGFGSSPEKAAEDAFLQIQVDCAIWGYKE